jgi:hypothetical protein
VRLGRVGAFAFKEDRMTQLRLPLPGARVADGVWAELGLWMCGEGPEPVELAAAAVARAHRRQVNAAAGRAK